MKKLLPLFFFIVILWLYGCNHKKETAFDKPTAVQMVHIDSFKVIHPDSLFSLSDPVCSMDLRESIADTILIQGKLYGFCSPACKKYFLKTRGAEPLK